MRDWIIIFRLKDGSEDEVIVSAACRMAAWEEFNQIVAENGWDVEAADCSLLSADYEREEGK